MHGKLTKSPSLIFFRHSANRSSSGHENAPTCPTFTLWRKVKGSVDEILETTTLEDIVDERITLLENIHADPEREEVRERAIKASREV